MRKYLILFFVALAIASSSCAPEAKPVHTFQSYGSCIFSLVFSPDGKTLASSSFRDVRLFDVNAGKEFCPLFYGLEESDLTFEALVFSPDGKILAGGSDSKILWLWDMDTHKEITKITMHDKPPPVSDSAIAFTPDGKTILARIRDESHNDGESDLNSITFWDVATHVQTGEVKLQPGRYSYIVFSPDLKIFATMLRQDDKRIITQDQQHIIKLYETDTGKLLKTIKPRDTSVGLVVFSPDGKTIAAVVGSYSVIHKNLDRFNTVQLWDVKTGNDILTIKGSNYHTNSLAFSPDGKTLASGRESEPIVDLWDVSSGKKITSLKGSLKGHENERDYAGRPKTDGVSIIAFSPNGKLLASGRDSETIDIWNIQGIGITAKPSSSTDNASDAKTNKQKGGIGTKGVGSLF
jgi:WD40 repeat protein